jgi:hypothetical protein
VQSKIRWNSSGASSYSEQPVASDPRFFYNFAAAQSIATSTAQNDSGMFEVSFRDERYLPFEGAGAVSQWLISMPQDSNAFDFETITDVILNLKYTARDGGASLRDGARQAARMPIPPPQSGTGAQPASYPSKQTNLFRYFSLKHEFPTEWYQFLNPADPSEGQVMGFALSRERFPFQYRGKQIQITGVSLYLIFKDEYPSMMTLPSTPQADYISGTALEFNLSPAGGTLSPTSGTPSFNSDSMLSGTPDWTSGSLSVKASLQPWQITISTNSVSAIASTLQVTVPQNAAGATPTYQILNSALIADIVLVCQYSAG